MSGMSANYWSIPHGRAPPVGGRITSGHTGNVTSGAVALLVKFWRVLVFLKSLLVVREDDIGALRRH
jgi:hypothetical protein